MVYTNVALGSRLVQCYYQQCPGYSPETMPPCPLLRAQSIQEMNELGVW